MSGIELSAKTSVMSQMAARLKLMSVFWGEGYTAGANVKYMPHFGWLIKTNNQSYFQGIVWRKIFKR